MLAQRERERFSVEVCVFVCVLFWGFVGLAVLTLFTLRFQFFDVLCVRFAICSFRLSSNVNGFVVLCFMCTHTHTDTPLLGLVSSIRNLLDGIFFSIICSAQPSQFKSSPAKWHGYFHTLVGPANVLAGEFDCCEP